METRPVTGSASGPTTADTHGSRQLGRDQFLQLLVTQLGNQDPTQPLDSHEFVAQLATFANVEQLEGVGSRLDALIIAQAAGNQTAVATLVGKDVVYQSDTVRLEGEAGASIGYELEGPAEKVTVTITDENGNVVRTIEGGPGVEGGNQLAWDGRNDDGELLPPGDYKVRVAAEDASGESVGATSRGRARVSAVSFENGYPELVVNGVRVKLSDVVEIAEAS